MKYKLFVADIDMTLVNHEKEMLPLTKAALQELRNRGVLIGVASGRPLRGHVMNCYKFWGLDRQLDLIIGMNGGQMYDGTDDTLTESYKLSREDIKEIIDFMSPLNLNPFVYKKDCMLVTRLDAEAIASSIRNKEPAIVAKSQEELWAAPNGKVLFRADRPDQMPAMLELAASHPSDHYQYFRSTPVMLEFQDPRVNKGVALHQFCEKHGIKKEEIISFGDSPNDIPILDYAGFSVCLSNGDDVTKSHADRITDYDYNNDGAGHFLFDYILK